VNKPEYSRVHKWDTWWLGDNISITDIDLASSGKAGINICDIKYRTPLLNKAQRELLVKHKLIHIVVLDFPENTENTNKYSFESPNAFLGMEAKGYLIYCPFTTHQIEWLDARRSYHIISDPQLCFTKAEIKDVLRGDKGWPCCGKPTYPK
jgi:hypothetical protein